MNNIIQYTSSEYTIEVIFESNGKKIWIPFRGGCLGLVEYITFYV